MRELTSFTHDQLRGWDPAARGGAGGPAQAPDPAAPPPRFNDLKSLEAALFAHKGLKFCTLCLGGRKVFVSEQVAYTKAGLAAHAASGDADGPLAEGGFSGHPACRFCRGARFYGEAELYTHMQTAHEHCFLCRRARPTEHVYYRDYPDLARHFSSAHHACAEAACLERRFVVFGTPAELGRHMAGEHGDALSKAERRAALTIAIDVPRYGGGAGGGPGGGASGGDRDRDRDRDRRGDDRRGGGGARSTGLDGAAAALRAARVAGGGSRGGLAEGGGHTAPHQRPPHPQRPPSPPRLGAADFPAGLAQAPSFTPAPTSASSSSSSAAGVLAARQAGVIRSARWAAAAGGGIGGGGAGGGLARDEFPALGGGPRKAAGNKRAAAAKGVAAAAARAAGPSSPTALPPLSRPQFPALAGLGAALPQRQPPPPPPQRDAFPALGGGSSAAAAVARARAAPAGPPPPRAVTAADFPALGGGGGRGGSRAPLPPAAAAPPPPPSTARVSPALAAANKALLTRVKGRLSHADLAAFREQSSRFARREGPPSGYYSCLARLGLGGLAPEMASLLPDPRLRAGLLDAWAAAARSAAPGKPGWAPPEAVAAARARPGAWACEDCGGINAPGEGACGAAGGCGGASGGGGAPRPPMPPPAPPPLPPLSSRASGSGTTSSGRAAGGRKGGNTKGGGRFSVSLTSGDPGGAAAALLDAGPPSAVRPGNAWTQPQRRRDLL